MTLPMTLIPCDPEPWLFTGSTSTELAAHGAGEELATIAYSSRPSSILYLMGDLVVEVVWDEHQFVASEESSGFFGEGDSIERALWDLFRSMHALWVELLERRDMLDEHMQRQLRTLTAAFTTQG